MLKLINNFTDLFKIHSISVTYCDQRSSRFGQNEQLGRLIFFFFSNRSISRLIKTMKSSLYYYGNHILGNMIFWKYFWKITRSFKNLIF